MNHDTPTPRNRLSGTHRRSCSWLDAVGPGFAVGPSGAVVDLASDAATRGYCE